MRPAIEEQRLADHGLEAIDAEWLGDQEGRFRRRTGEEALRICRDEDHRHGKALEYLVHRIKPGTAVGELDVCEDKTRTMLADFSDRFFMGACNTDDLVPEFFH